jgi:hypothetical protein
LFYGIYQGETANQCSEFLAKASQQLRDRHEQTLNHQTVTNEPGQSGHQPTEPEAQMVRTARVTA